jgi:hypothetical protein
MRLATDDARRRHFAYKPGGSLGNLHRLQRMKLTATAQINLFTGADSRVFGAVNNSPARSYETIAFIERAELFPGYSPGADGE